MPDQCLGSQANYQVCVDGMSISHRAKWFRLIASSVDINSLVNGGEGSNSPPLKKSIRTKCLDLVKVCL